jgi:predicted nucleotidyltransferase
VVRLNQYILNSIKEIFKDYPIYLFGSRTKDTKGGDIDLFIDEELSLKEVIKLKVKLLKKIGDRKIDIVSKKYANEILKQEVYKNGIRL